VRSVNVGRSELAKELMECEVSEEERGPSRLYLHAARSEGAASTRLGLRAPGRQRVRIGSCNNEQRREDAKEC